MSVVLRRLLGPALLVVAVLGACAGGQGAAGGDDDCRPTEAERLQPRVHRTTSHNTDAFTQGLVVHEGRLFESTGLEGRSSIRELDPDTGEVLRSMALTPDVFAEGLAVGAGGRLVQLTWTDGVAYEWEPDTFEVARRFSYDSEGWGLSTLDDGTLVMSDGSDTLTFRDPEDFSVSDRRTIRRHGGPADQLNELEWDGQRLWANRYLTDEIVGIDLECGTVVAVLDVSGLAEDAEGRREAGDPDPDVSNGIAHLSGTDRYLLTGKLWPAMYEVTLEPSAGAS